jgi:rSAM/selenodomain-associated transferase 1
MTDVPRRALTLFTKPARPGRVKTRLIGDLSPEQAARLHEALLGDVLANLRDGPYDLRVAWALDPDDALPDGPPPGLRQEGRDLGERMWNALRDSADGATAVAAVGSDHPRLTRGRVAEAFELVEGGEGIDVALGPAADGGYYLIVLRPAALRWELFAGVEWSTPRVLAQTLAACERLGLRARLLPEEHDVDTPEDLRRLAATLAAGSAAGPAPNVSDPCPRTRRLLAAWGRLSPDPAVSERTANWSAEPREVEA